MLSHMKDVCGKCIRNLKSDNGQGLVEYALILVLIAIVVIAAVKGIGCNANTTFSTINSTLTKPAQ